MDAGPDYAAEPLLLLERPPSRPVAPAVEAPALPPSAAAVEADDHPVIPADTLFFEFSCNTGRLHALQQEGDVFKHLGSVPSAQLALDSEMAVEYPFPYTLPAVRSAAAAFLAVWNALPAVDRNALWRVGKPLRLPFDDSLAAARAVHKSVLSTLRTVKPVDLIPPPPAGSTGPRYVYLPLGNRERKKYSLYISAEGVWLCLACSREPARVQHPEGPSDPLVSCLLDLYCSEACHDRCVRCAGGAALLCDS